MLGSRAETRAPGPIPSEPLSPRSFSWEDPGIPEAMQDPEQGSVPQGSEQRQVPLPAAPGPPLLSFLLPAGWVILALEPKTFQKADQGVAQGRGTAECASREGAGWAGAPLPCSHPQRALIRMLRWAAGRPHPGITPATYPPGPKAGIQSFLIWNFSHSLSGVRERCRSLHTVRKLRSPQKHARVPLGSVQKALPHHVGSGGGPGVHPGGADHVPELCREGGCQDRCQNLRVHGGLCPPAVRLTGVRRPALAAYAVGSWTEVGLPEGPGLAVRVVAGAGGWKPPGGAGSSRLKAARGQPSWAPGRSRAPGLPGDWGLGGCQGPQWAERLSPLWARGSYSLEAPGSPWWRSGRPSVCAHVCVPVCTRECAFASMCVHECACLCVECVQVWGACVQCLCG